MNLSWYSSHSLEFNSSNIVAFDMKYTFKPKIFFKKKKKK